MSNALARWNLETAACTLVAARENQVFQVTGATEVTALRVHRAGLRSSAELRSELVWMVELSRAGISVPVPVPAADGDFLQEIDGRQVSMLAWLPGEPLGRTSEPLAHPDRAGLFTRLGEIMAQMHAVSDTWIPPAGFVRASWDRAALVGPDPLWGRFWENPLLLPAQKELLQRFRETADRNLRELEADLDFGLIHADLVRENVMIDGDKLHLIDFDDCGFGYRLFDLATALIKNMLEPDYPDLRDALLRGYRQYRPLDTAALDLFLALRAVTYVGWIASRMDEDGSEERCRRMITQAVRLAEACLADLDGLPMPNTEVSP